MQYAIQQAVVRRGGGTISPDISTLSRIVARRYSVPGWTREDLIQEAYAAMLEAGPERGPGVLIRCAQRRLQTIYRRSRRDACRLATPVVDDARPVGSHIQSEEEYRRLLSLVTPCQSLILDLGFRHGLSDDAIAAALGMSVGAVHTARCRALGRIRTSEM